MKKLSILIGMFLLVLQAANAQNQKGDQTLGVSLGFAYNTGNYNYQGMNAGAYDYSTSYSTNFSTNPNYSYFVANNLDIGVSLGFGNGTYSYSDQTNNTTSKQVDKNYYSSLYLRKYFLFKNKIGIRTGPYLAYQYYDSSMANTSVNSPINSFSGNNYHAGIIADFVYYPASKIGLAINLGSLSYNKGKYNSLSQSYGGNGINLGFLNNNLMLSAFYVLGN